jgi:sugar transferase (PEP-CTERM/EpsH1 system associated)
MEHAERKGISVCSLGRREGIDARLMKRLYSLLKNNSYDLVHTHNYAPLFYGAPLAKLAGVPARVYTQHGVTMFPCSRKRLTALKILSHFIDRWVTVSHSVRSEIIEYTGLSEVKFVTIVNGIDAGKFKPSIKNDLKHDLGLERFDLIIGTVGRLSPEKDHATLIEAFRLIPNQSGNTCLVIVGDGKQRSQLESMIEDLGLNTTVFLLGNRTDIPDVLANFDIFVNSSKSEGIPLTILEAMACGLPVVATRVGGNPEIIADEVTGLMVPSQDAQAMKNAIVSILQDPEKMKQMGMEGRRRAEQYFSLEAMTEQYLSEYAKIVEEKMHV